MLHYHSVLAVNVVIILLWLSLILVLASGEAETSMTYPVKCTSLRRGGYVILQGIPCN